MNEEERKQRCKKQREYYEKNKNNKKWIEKNNEKVKNWRRNNPERFKELKKRENQKNQKKQISRHQTSKVIYGRGGVPKTKVPIDFYCKKCKAKINLQIHHEVYPTKKATIEKAIIDGKIYFLCKQCHVNRRIKKTQDLNTLYASCMHGIQS